MIYRKCRLVNQNINDRRPYFLLLTSHFMFWTYEDLKQNGVGELWEGGARRVVLAHGLHA